MNSKMKLVEKNPNGFGAVGIVAVVAVLVVLAGGGYFAYQRFAKPIDNGRTACSAEAKLCPDGSYVSRIGPNCEFAECPKTATTTSAVDPSNWKTYRNELVGISFRYPPEWGTIRERREGCVDDETHSSMTEVDGRPCLTVDFSTDRVGIFLGAQTKLKKEYGAPRGGYFVDETILDSIQAFCSRKTIVSVPDNRIFLPQRCEIRTNPNGVMFAKTYEVTYEWQAPFKEEFAHYWWILRPEHEFAGLVVTDERFKDTAFFGNAERQLDELVNTLEFLQPLFDITNWKTYRNEQYGFEFDYPQRYKLTEQVADFGSYSHIITLISELYKNWPSNTEGPPSVSLIIHSNTNKLTVIEWAKANVGYSNFRGNYDAKVISGSQAISYSWEGLGFGRTTLISKDTAIYMLNTLFYNPKDEIVADYNLVLSTFKFIK